MTRRLCLRTAHRRTPRLFFLLLLNYTSIQGFAAPATGFASALATAPLSPFPPSHSCPLSRPRAPATARLLAASTLHSTHSTWTRPWRARSRSRPRRCPTRWRGMMGSCLTRRGVWSSRCVGGGGADATSCAGRVVRRAHGRCRIGCEEVRRGGGEDRGIEEGSISWETYKPARGGEDGEGRRGGFENGAKKLRR
jgi:hypothetical protein